MPKSRKTRTELEALGDFCGKKNSANISNIMVTTSTVSWVNAKSGAEKRVKAIDTIKPTTDSISREIMR